MTDTAPPRKLRRTAASAKAVRAEGPFRPLARTLRDHPVAATVFLLAYLAVFAFAFAPKGQFVHFGAPAVHGAPAP